MTALTSSSQSSAETAASTTRSESPTPRMSNQITRANRFRELMNSATNGCSQSASRWLAQSSTSTMSRGPSPITWYAR